MTVQDQLTYEFGSVRLNPLTRTLMRAGELVPIQPRGFDALLLLVQRRGEVVSKGELLATIWPDTHVEESNLPVMISGIRRAIGDDGRNQKYLQTVSKSGYRFVGEVRETGAPHPAAAHRHAETQSNQADDGRPNRRLPYARPIAVGGSLALALFVIFLVARFKGAMFNNPMNEASVAAAVHTPRTEAEVWSQKGRYAWNLQTKDGLLRSIEYYQKAIAADPNYAPSYAGLARSYVTLPSYSHRPEDQRVERGRAAAAMAARLDDRLADTHVALGMVSLILDRNFAQAAREFRRALALDSRSSLAEGELAFCLIAVGQTEEAIAHARQAKALDPLSIRAATDLGIVLYYGHRFTEAESEYEEVLKLDPYSYRANVNLGKAYLSVGRFEDASRVLEKAAVLSNHDPIADGLIAATKALSGDIRGAEAILATLEQRERTSYVAPISLAYALAGLGRAEATLAYLKKTQEDRTIGAIFLNVDPDWALLHGNPEFRELVQDIRMPATGN